MRMVACRRNPPRGAEGATYYSPGQRPGTRGRPSPSSPVRALYDTSERGVGRPSRAARRVGMIFPRALPWDGLGACRRTRETKALTVPPASCRPRFPGLFRWRKPARRRRHEFSDRLLDRPYGATGLLNPPHREGSRRAMTPLDSVDPAILSVLRSRGFSMRSLSVRRAARAFTLVELLIVVAIIAILAAIALVNYRLASDRALSASCKANLRAIDYALKAYKIDYNRYPPADGTAGDEPTPTMTTLRNGPAADGSWCGVSLLLVKCQYVTDSRALYCPTLPVRLQLLRSRHRRASGRREQHRQGFRRRVDLPLPLGPRRHGLFPVSWNHVSPRRGTRRGERPVHEWPGPADQGARGVPPHLSRESLSAFFPEEDHGRLEWPRDLG